MPTGGAAKDKEKEEKHQKEGLAERGAPESLSGQQLSRAQSGLTGRKPDGPGVQHWNGQVAGGAPSHGAGGLPRPEEAVRVLPQQQQQLHQHQQQQHGKGRAGSLSGHQK